MTTIKRQSLREDLAVWNARLSVFFHEAKAAKLMVSVVYTTQHVHEGRIYRNAYDRVNVIGLIEKKDGTHYREIYYNHIAEASTTTVEPEGLQLFFGDWDYFNTPEKVKRMFNIK